MITKKNKRGALEMSITTIVIVVIAVAALILGLVLVRNIFQGATVSVDTINDQILSEIQRSFQSGDSYIFIRLEADKIARIEPGSTTGVVVGASTTSGNVFDESDVRLDYDLEFEPGDNCEIELVNPEEGSGISFDRAQGSTAGAVIFLRANAGAGSCGKPAKVIITVNEDNDPIAKDSFFVDVARGGLFG